MTARERIDRSLQMLREGLNSYVAQQMSLVYRNTWLQQAKQSLRDATFEVDQSGQPRFDITALAAILLGHWDDVFGKILSKREQRILHRIRDIRNDHAHQVEFSLDRAIGALEDVETLLNSIGAGEQAEEVRRLKEQTGAERYGVVSSSPEQAPRLLEAPVVDKTLAPWRDVIIPHPDVVSRRFANAEFAADLFAVWRGAAGPEYADRAQFFARTYLTSGLSRLLEIAARRFTDKGGDPVVELQTSFGGGKTHALVALYHLAAGGDLAELPGVLELLEPLGISKLPEIRVAVLVGTKIQAGQPSLKHDGTRVNTLWGELAYQLGGAEGYAMVAGADQTATNPGSALDELIEKYSPCLILVDEWVAYARQLGDETLLCGGSFETQFTFAQTLTESVSATPGALVVVSLPVSEDRQEGSDIEVGGVRGREALRRLRNVIARKQANWQPADAAESYAIVRRRLFEVLDASRLKQRDRAVATIAKYYREKASHFPQYCSEPAYKDKLEACYPIHPELFERLYNEWGSLEQFQRTRGVLRLMAAVIHTLWANNDRSPLIIPGLIPLEDPTIVGDLIRYLGTQWHSVLARDVVGPDSLATRLDERYATFGRFTAARRVARAIFLATAPQNAEGSTSTRNVGIDSRAIRLSCSYPGDQLGVYDEAARRLAEEATHVNTDGTRYWVQLSANLNRRAHDYAAQYEQRELHDEIIRDIQSIQRDRADFVRIHCSPRTTADVPDEPGTALVIFGPQHPHTARRDQTDARDFALHLVAKAGESIRRFKNCLIFLAPDAKKLDDLELAVRQALAWKKICLDRVQLELTPSQEQQAQEKLRQADIDVARLIRASWSHILTPTQAPEAGAPITLRETRVDSGDSVPQAVSRKLQTDGLLTTILGGVNLRTEMDSKSVWGSESHIRLDTLYGYFAQYPYLRRLKDEQTLHGGVRSGLDRTTWQTETFAYAESYDASTKTYKGLVAGSSAATLQIDMDGGLLVRPEVAVSQFERTASAKTSGRVENGSDKGVMPGFEARSNLDDALSAVVFNPRHFFLRVQVDDPTKLPRIAAQLGNDIVAHLATAPGIRRVEVAIEVKAEAENSLDQGLVERLNKNTTAHGFPRPEYTD